MYQITDLERAVFREPYQNGYRNLKVLSGYASSAFLTHIMDDYPDLSLELIIGMASKDGIMDWDHKRFKQIARNNPQVKIKYQKTLPGIHSKIYHWYKQKEFDTPESFFGSSNFSWAGFRDQTELMGKVSFPNISEVFKRTDTISCVDVESEEEISINHMEPLRNPNQSYEILLHETSQDFPARKQLVDLSSLESVELSLLKSNGKEIHDKGGLNWGQRKGREPNQAYIPVPLPINRIKPNFFPPFKHTFAMLTDDNKQLSCIMAQQNRKAIQTTDSNSLLGRYFRRRLDIPFDSKILMEDLMQYGRTSITIYKIDGETYFMDFNKTHIRQE